jgi:phospholipase B1
MSFSPLRPAHAPDFPWSPPTYNEYRGLSYPIGRDPLALTIPNILSHYVPSLSGGSVGKHPLVSCFSGLGVHIGCEHPEGDGTNAAISGSIAAGLVGQVRGEWAGQRG